MADRVAGSHAGPRDGSDCRSPPLDCAGITKQFSELLSQRRMNELTSKRSRRTHGSRTPHDTAQHTLDPYHQTLHNIPKIPVPPAESDTNARRFCSMLSMLSVTPEKYENPGLLDEALGEIPLQQLYDEADEENNIAIVSATSAAEDKGEGDKGVKRRIKWGYQDHVIMALLRWFKTSFMTWVNNPPCSACGMPTIAIGMATPTADDKARGANKVELFRCSDTICNSQERFPRYGDVWAVMRSKRGRVGEWANCFTMLCRAMGSKVRWVWNAEEHAWTEVWSDHARRWVHVDSCEGAWDQPRMYSEGWGRKLSYCIAFGVDGATDVTRRYVRDPARFGAERKKCPEAVLMWMLNELRRKKRKNMDKHEQQRLLREDAREEKELRGFVVHPLIAELEKVTLKVLRPASLPVRPAPAPRRVPAPKPSTPPASSSPNKIEERAAGTGAEEYERAKEAQRAQRAQQEQQRREAH